MNHQQRKTLEAIFKNPVPASILWKDIESLLIALDCEISEGRGSRVRVKKDEVFAVFHRPHPQKETDKGAVISVRDYLTKLGVQP